MYFGRKEKGPENAFQSPNGRNDSVFASRRDTHLLPGEQAPRSFGGVCEPAFAPQNRTEFTHHFNQKSTNTPQGHICAFVVGMQHSPKVRQDLVCEAYIKDGSLTKKKKDVRRIKTNTFLVGMTGYSLCEDTHSCRLVSKLPDLSEVYANLHLLRKTEPNLHIISIKKSTNTPQGHVCAFLVGMQHSPKVKQDLVCEAYIKDGNLTKKEKRCSPD